MYLDLADKYADSSIESRLEFFLLKDQKLVCDPDTEFRFHSGPISNE